MPGAVRTQRHGLLLELTPNPAPRSLFENHCPSGGHSSGFHHEPCSVRADWGGRCRREVIRAVPRLAAVAEARELLALGEAGVALQRLVGLRVVEAERGVDARPQDGADPDGREDGDRVAAGVLVRVRVARQVRHAVPRRGRGSARARPRRRCRACPRTSGGRARWRCTCRCSGCRSGTGCPGSCASRWCPSQLTATLTLFAPGSPSACWTAPSRGCSRRSGRPATPRASRPPR